MNEQTILGECEAMKKILLLLICAVIAFSSACAKSDLPKNNDTCTNENQTIAPDYDIENKPQTTPKATSEVGGNAGGKTAGDAGGKTAGDAGGKTGGDAGGKTGGDTSGKTGGDAGGKAGGNAGDKTGR